MGKKKQSQQRLGHRERQIMDAVHQLGEASVGDVLKNIPDPPSYSAIRKMMTVLEQKGMLSHRREGTRYVYKPTVSQSRARKSAVKRLLSTYFSESPTDAVNAILDASTKDLTDEDFKELRAMIDRARKEGK